MSVLRQHLYNRQSNTKPLADSNTTAPPLGFGWQSLGPACAITALALYVLSLRLYTRIVLIRYVGLEDVLISMAMDLGLTVLQILSIVMLVCMGFPRVFSVVLRLIIIQLSITWLCLSYASMNLVKASIITQYIQLSRGEGSQLARRICYGVLGLILVAFLYAFLLTVSLCQPWKKTFHPSIPGKCFPISKYVVSIFTMNTALDIIVVCLPIPVLRRLQLPRRERGELAFILFLGTIACMFGIVRFALSLHYALAGRFNDFKVATTMWCALEINTGITCASLWCIKPLIQRMFPRLLESQTPARNNMRLNKISVSSTIDTREGSTAGFIPPPEISTDPERIAQVSPITKSYHRRSSSTIPTVMAYGGSGEMEPVRETIYEE
ncbi:hypothetical protein EJ08DRAFT_577943 [Tothia fuscella]|uniref:Rhodopsin domain-containing protein n=1 Tax=Tothia fuscella TaxID=1048955 RepID=A0A9P4P400_9PEZI|nr:hypothetical protein EJ08DRAFT_577943 [Tothia fuscella]